MLQGLVLSCLCVNKEVIEKKIQRFASIHDSIYNSVLDHWNLTTSLYTTSMDSVISTPVKQLISATGHITNNTITATKLHAVGKSYIAACMDYD